MANLNTNKGREAHAKKLQKIYGTPKPAKNEQAQAKPRKASKKQGV